MSRSSSNPASPRIPGLAHRFADPGLLERALTHRSFGRPNNERLEFLGDAVLNCVVARMLFDRHPDLDEGLLSRLRSLLVREESLAEIADRLELGRFIRLGPGELKSGGYLRPSILADAVEALIGAVFLDAGYDAACAQIEAWLGDRVASPPALDSLKDPKTRLQEALQARGLSLPSYELLEQSGPDHARRFTVSCTTPLLDQPVVATASSRRKAEQAAARQALRRIESERVG
ncbi:MAG: ribonuclease III [Wenzhouxiangellaceae bacterium]